MTHHRRIYPDLRAFLPHAVKHPDLGSHNHLARAAFTRESQYPRSRAHLVRKRPHVLSTLRMHHYFSLRVPLLQPFHVARQDAVMRRAVAVPEDDVVSAQPPRRPAAETRIGNKDYLPLLRERIHYLRCIR